MNIDNDVYVVNEDSLKNKIVLFKKAGLKNIQVLSDFDKTLTKAFSNGKKLVSSYAHFRERDLVKGFTEVSKQLHAKYYPIENDSSISLEEKKKAMEEWWTTSYNTLVKCGFSKKVLDVIVKDELIFEREGISDFFSKLHNFKIPVVIFSAGIGDLITEFLKNKRYLSDNVSIVSNMFNYDNSGVAISYKKPLIHSYSKNEKSLEHLSIYSELKKRKNVILLGDTLGDLSMTDGFSYDNIIRFGFLSDDIAKEFDEYKKHFDVIILHDGKMDYVNKIINDILT
ncbi:MAG: hypothetical protein WC755_01130 [Candidatus Woesearchaeota archaeon]|jgi:5'-nucleotidase